MNEEVRGGKESESGKQRRERKDEVEGVEWGGESGIKRSKGSMSNEDRGIPPMTSGGTRVPTSWEFGRELREGEEEEEAG